MIRNLFISMFLILLLNETAKAKTPVAGVIEFYPFGYVDDKGLNKGLVFDSFKVIEKYSNLTVKPVLLSIPRALRDIKSGKIDLLYSFKDEKMVRNVEYLGSLGCITVLAVPSTESAFTNLEKIAGKKVGFVAQGYFDVNKNKYLPFIPVRATDSFTLISMLVAGRIDVMIVNDVVLNGFYNTDVNSTDLPSNWRDKLASPIRLKTMETHISISRDSNFKVLIPKFKEAIVEAKANQEFVKLFNKYGTNNGVDCDTTY